VFECDVAAPAVGVTRRAHGDAQLGEVFVGEFDQVLGQLDGLLADSLDPGVFDHLEGAEKRRRREDRDGADLPGPR
jgi:hypothetical protein